MSKCDMCRKKKSESKLHPIAYKATNYKFCSKCMEPIIKSIETARIDVKKKYNLK